MSNFSSLTIDHLAAPLAPKLSYAEHGLQPAAKQPQSLCCLTRFDPRAAAEALKAKNRAPLGARQL
jgi:hypothetical protein